MKKPSFIASIKRDIPSRQLSELIYQRGGKLIRVMTACLSLSLILWTKAVPAAETSPGTGAAEIKLPLLVWDINYNRDRVGMPPRSLTKEEIEARDALGVWRGLPITTHAALEYLSVTHTALVVKEAAGLTDQPLLLSFPDGEPSCSGPRVAYRIPDEIAIRGLLWHLSLDVAKNNLTHAGGLRIWDATEVGFSRDGLVRAGEQQIGSYTLNRPLHIDCVINVADKTVQITIDGKTEATATLPWYMPQAPCFRLLELWGLMGAYAAPGSIAFDNIRLVLEEMR